MFVKKIKKHFPLGGMIIATCLMIVGFLIVLFLGSLPTYIFGGFFVFVGLYCWYLYICNVLIGTKEDVLYLKEKNGNNYLFLSKRGKRFNYHSKKEYKLNKFYTVLKSKDYIENIISISNKKFDVVLEKESYWLNLYLPVGDFEDIFLLPVLYVIAAFSVSLLFYQGVIDFGAIIMGSVSIYLIIYDLIYKIKKKKSKFKNKKVDDEKLLKSFEIFINIIRIISIGFVCLFLFYLFMMMGDFFSRLILLPFLLCACCLFWQTIAMIKKNDLMVEILGKMYIVIFLLYWFGVIGVCAYTMIIDEQYSMTLFLIPFILAGVYVVFDTFFKKK